MRAEMLLWRIAIACAALLMIAPTTPRTSWVFERGGGMTHSAGWDWIAALSGIVAITALSFARWSRPRVSGAAIGTAIAAIAFGVSAAASAGHWITLMSGLMELQRRTLYPAPLVLPFAAIAIAGAVSSLVLLDPWLRPDIRS